MGGCSCGGRWQQGTASLWPGASGSSGHSRGENFGSGDCLGGRQSVRCLESRGREQIRRAGCTGRGPTNGMPVLSAARQRGLQRGTKSEPEVQGAAPAWVCLCETEQAIPKQEGGSGGGVGWHEAPSLSSRRAEQSGASPRQPSPVSREANIGRSAADALRISSRGPKREHKVLRMPSSRQQGGSGGAARGPDRGRAGVCNGKRAALFGDIREDGGQRERPLPGDRDAVAQGRGGRAAAAARHCPVAERSAGGAARWGVLLKHVLRLCNQGSLDFIRVLYTRVGRPSFCRSLSQGVEEFGHGCSSL
eukprot:355471-Chlamydomonas_euryale.AAC.7